MFDHIQLVYYRLHLYSFFVDLWAQLLIFQTLFSVQASLEWTTLVAVHQHVIYYIQLN